MHKATTRFWKLYNSLPENIRLHADKSFNALKTDPGHPSLHFKKTGKFWSVRIDFAYRALAVYDKNDYIWVWIRHP